MEFPLQSATNSNTHYSLLDTLQTKHPGVSLHLSSSSYRGLWGLWTLREALKINLYNNIKMRDLTSKLRDQHQCRGATWKNKTRGKGYYRATEVFSAIEGIIPAEQKERKVR